MTSMYYMASWHLLAFLWRPGEGGGLGWRLGWAWGGFLCTGLTLQGGAR